jgi:D-alanyl-D-alanine carboxypeptidase
MVTPEVVAAFRLIGWGWGGAWSGSTKDYMHFSQSGH